MMAGDGGGDTGRYDLRISEGKIAGIEVAGAAEVGAATVKDMRGGLVLPAFADIHTHIDKGHIWPRRPNPDGTWLSALLSVAADRQRNWASGDVERRMDFALRCAHVHGTAALRTHLDGVPPQDEISWPVFDAVRERWAGRIELQAVSLVSPDNLLDLAILRRIAERTKRYRGILGGAMAEHPQSRQAMLNVVEMAGEYGLDLDIHADETGDPASSVLLHLAEAVLETGYDGRVLAGHCCVLTVQDEATQLRTIEKVAEAGIAVVSLPMCNLYLQDRDGSATVTPIRRGVTLLREMKAAGIPVAIASDNTRDPFYAYGDLDALEVLREGARILHFDHPQDEAWNWARSVTGDAAAIAGFAFRAQIAVGAPADLVLFGARTWTELLSRPQHDRIVLRDGMPVDTALPDYRELDDLMEA
jgi:cytosine deaminase